MSEVGRSAYLKNPRPTNPLPCTKFIAISEYSYTICTGWKNKKTKTEATAIEAKKIKYKRRLTFFIHYR